MSGDAHRAGPAFWVALAVGGALMAWGGWLLLDAVADTGQRVNFAVFLVGADLVHDLVVAPLVVLVGWGLSRLVPPPWKAPVQAGAFASAMVVVLAWLPLHDTGAAARNPTIQPLDYGAGTTTALVAVWLAVAAWGTWRRRARPGDQTASR